jgi:two-component system LytT family response regulator
MEKLRALIVDDIKESRINLKVDLADYCPEIEVVAEAESVITSLKAIKDYQPNIVFLDIHLTDGSGFDVLELLPKIDFKVIFTTASDAFAIKAFKFSAIDYLLKPLDPEELQNAVKQAVGQYKLEHAQVELLLDSVKRTTPLEKIALHTSDKIHVIELQQIVRLESSGNYTEFYLKDKTKILVSKTLKVYDQMLREAGFVRIHQSHLINASYVKEFVKQDGGYILMKDGSAPPISARKKADVISILFG